jgi:5'(3')-deoxyribonucleotidase
MRILVDIDGVLADFVTSFMRCYEYLGGEVPKGFKWEEWGSFERLPDQDLINAAWSHPMLFNGYLDPYPGAMAALKKLNKAHEVFLITSIASPWEIHVPARTRWLRNNAPFLDIRKQVIVANNKGLVQGDILVDDYLVNLDEWKKWNPSGAAMVIDHPWNRHEGGFVRWPTFEDFVVCGGFV